MAQKPTGKPVSVANSSAIPLEIQRALRSLEGRISDLGGQLASTNEGLDGKLGNGGKDLLSLSQTLRTYLQANGPTPLDITKLPGVAAQAQLNGLGYLPLNPANNLSDVANTTTARHNLGAAGLADANIFTALNAYNAGAIYKTPPGTAQLILDGTTAGQQVVVQFFDNGTPKWVFGKAADQSFFLFDNVHGNSVLSTDPTTGYLTFSVTTIIIGPLVVASAGQNTTTNGKTITFYDTSSGAAALVAADNASSLNALEITKSGSVVACKFPNGPVNVASLSFPAVSNPKVGSGTLTAGTVTIANASITANSKVFLQRTGTPGATSGELSVASKTAGTGFVVTSTLVGDAGTFDYFIVETA